MRRFVAIVMLLCAVHTVSAQLVVGGVVGFEKKSTGYTTQGMEGSDGTLTNGKLFTLSPRVGFALGKRVELGLSPNVSYSVYIHQTGTYGDNTKEWSALTEFNKDWLVHSLAPYLRVRVLHLGRLALSAEFTGDILWYDAVDGTQSTAGDDGPRWNILLSPVVTCRLGDHANLELYLNMLTLGYSGEKEKAQMIHVYDEEVIEDPLEFGVSAAASKGTLLSVGLSWHL